jgi:hypothetical protein
MTPMTMKETFPRVFMFGGERPMTQEVIRTATGVVACLFASAFAHLETE